MKNLQHVPLKHQGFILVATIWMLAAVTIVASAFAIWVQRSLDLMTQQTQQTQSSLEMVGTKSTLLYLLSTQVKNQAGLILSDERKSESQKISQFFDPMSISIPPITGEELRLDNQPYRGIKSAIFSLQDEAGLINVNAPRSKLLNLFLLRQGFTPQQTKGLIAKLVDYIDEDDLSQLRGAEAFHYKKANMPPPPNKSLKSQFELVNVMGWNHLLEKQPNIFNSLTATNVFLININTASHSVLSLLPGIDRNKANIIIQARNQHAFETLGVADKATGLLLDRLYESITTFPSRHTRIYLWHKNSRLIQQFSVQSTPTSRLGKPWKINSTFELSKGLSKVLSKGLPKELSKPLAAQFSIDEKPSTYDNQPPIKPQTDLFDSAISSTAY